jgi:hypothetical protein
VILAGARLERVGQHVQRREADLAGAAHGSRLLGDDMSCLRDWAERLDRGLLLSGLSAHIDLSLRGRSRV